MKAEELHNLVRAARTVRRFDASVQIPEETLLRWVDAARCTPSAANLQPLKYLLSCTEPLNSRIFETLKWAGYLADWDGPAPSERPAAYLVMLTDTSISKQADMDCGIAAQTLRLSAAAEGFGGCMFGSIDRPRLRTVLDLDEALRIPLVLAFGAPSGQVQIEDADASGGIRYWRTEDGVHHVPKRSLNEIIIQKGIPA